jgi:hypothetical protein
MRAHEGPWYLRPRTFRRRDFVVFQSAVLAALLGFVLAVGWSLVRFPRYSSSQPAPSWLPWLAAALMGSGAVAFLVTLARASLATDHSASDRGAGDSHSWDSRPVGWIVWLAFGPLPLLFVSLASTQSTSRWDPMALAGAMVVAYAGLRFAGARKK